MKVKQVLSKWSRTIHRWIGLYFAAIVLLYFTEFLVLPAVFSEGLPTVDGTPPIHTALSESQNLLSFDRATQTFIDQNPKGIHSADEIDAISYLPNSGLYRFEDHDRYFEWYIDAQSGEVLKFGFKTDLFLEDKGILGWLNPVVHEVIEFPMLLLLVSLAISGVYLFITPFLLKKDNSIPEVVSSQSSDTTITSG
jgi:hypothetical protein